MNQNDPLADLYEEEETDPLAELYEEEVVSTTPEESSPEDVDYWGQVVPAIKETAQGFGRTIANLPNTLEEFNTGVTSGATIGASKNIPGFEGKGTGAFKTGEFVGSFLPISKLINTFTAPLQSLVKNVPYFQKSASALANLTGSAIAGSSYKVAEDAFAGNKLDPEEVLEHGASWAVLDAVLQAAGATGRFAKNLINTAFSKKVSPVAIINDVANSVIRTNTEPTVDAIEKALENVGKSQSTPLSERISYREVTKPNPKENLEYLEKIGIETSEPMLPEKLTAEEIIQDTRNSEAQEVIDNFEQRSASDKEFGEAIKENVDTSFAEEQKIYEPLYLQVEQAAENINHSPKSAINLAKNTTTKLKSLKTRPTGYNIVIKTLEDAISDMGSVEIPGSEVINLQGKTVRPKSPNIEYEIPLSKTMELARRLNKIINYDIIGPDIKNQLKPLVKQLKQEIRSTLRTSDPVALKAFEKAERAFADTANKFGRDSINKIRALELTEQVAKIIESPTALGDLKAIVNPGQFRLVERELLQKIHEAPASKSEKMYREFSPYFSTEAKIAAQDALNAKIPLKPNVASTSEKIADTILKDIDVTATSGQRPNKTLKLWQTKRGQKLITKAMKNRPEGKQVINYLKNQSLNDFISSFVEVDGKINFKKLKDILKDPAVKENIKLIGGQDAVEFFEQLENLSKKFENELENLSKYSKKQEARFESLKSTGEKLTPSALKKAARGQELITRTSERAAKSAKEIRAKNHPFLTRLEEIENKSGPIGTALFSLMGLAGPGLVNSVAIYSSYRLFKLLAESKSFRDAIRNAVKKRNNPTAFISGLERIADQINDE